jgi:hypothetical protein
MRAGADREGTTDPDGRPDLVPIVFNGRPTSCRNWDSRRAEGSAYRL